MACQSICLIFPAVSFPLSLYRPRNFSMYPRLNQKDACFLHCLLNHKQQHNTASILSLPYLSIQISSMKRQKGSKICLGPRALIFLWARLIHSPESTSSKNSSLGFRNSCGFSGFISRFSGVNKGFDEDINSNTLSSKSFTVMVVDFPDGNCNLLTDGCRRKLCLPWNLGYTVSFKDFMNAVLFIVCLVANMFA